MCLTITTKSAQYTVSNTMDKKQIQKEAVKQIKKICKETGVGCFLLTDSMTAHIQTENGSPISEAQREKLKERLFDSFDDMYSDYLDALSLDLETEEE